MSKKHDEIAIMNIDASTPQPRNRALGNADKSVQSFSDALQIALDWLSQHESAST